MYNQGIKPKKLTNLEKVIKKNPKYEYVKSTIDTGSSITKYMKKIDEIKANYRYQQDEIFRRMKVTTFAQLVLQVAEIDVIERESRIEDEIESLRNMNDNGIENQTPREIYSVAETERVGSKLQGLVRGIGEYDVLQSNTQRSSVSSQMTINTPTPNSNVNSNTQETPYLLLDIRDRDEYNQCHIISAINYPAAMLSRSINNETKELLAYKNQPGKIIVIYDDDERIAPKAATTFVERGYDNLFMLSGGLKLASKKFPDGLITGSLPQAIAKDNLKEMKTLKLQRLLSEDPVTSYPIYQSGVPASKTTFEPIDIEKLEKYLEKSLLPDDTGSRLTRNNSSSNNMSSRGSVTSAQSNFSKTSSVLSKPWK